MPCRWSSSCQTHERIPSPIPERQATRQASNEVLIPALAGFSKAVKLAASLQFSIESSSATECGSDRRTEAGADYYLHQSLVSQPIEPFHGMLIASITAVRARSGI
jgi:hypothetical protein